MSKPFGASSFTANLDVNAGFQPSSHDALPSSIQPEDADEPPCSGKQARLLPIVTTGSVDDASTPTTTSTNVAPYVDSTNTNTKGGIIVFNEKIPVATVLEEGGTRPQTASSPRKIRFKLPVALPHLAKRSRLRALFTPTRRIGPAPSHGRSFINIFKFSPLNVLLVFLPISWALHFTHQSNTLIFATSALAVLPLAALLGFGTEQVAVRTSSAVAALLNASLGNLTELIIAGICLSRCQLALVQSTLLGGLLSNLLLVLGSAFIVGGFRYPQLSFRPAAAQLNASLLTVGVISMIIPTVFHTFLGAYFPDGPVEGPMLLKMSRAFSVVLIFIYGSYLGFQFYTHSHLFLDMDSDSDSDSHLGTWGGSSSSSSSSGCSSSSSSFKTTRSRRSSAAHTTATTTSMILATQPGAMVVDEEAAIMPIHPLTPVDSISSVGSKSSIETIHYPLVNMPSAFILLGSITSVMYLTAENLVDSLTGLTDANPTGTSKEFLSVILLPVLSNGAELSTAVYAGYKGRFDLVLGVAVGSCTQITLFVIPLLVTVAWGMGKPLSLLFDPLETSSIFLTVLLVKFVIEDGRTHWLNGVTLVCVYIMLATTFWHFPTSLMGLLGGNQTLFMCGG